VAVASANPRILLDHVSVDPDAAQTAKGTGAARRPRLLMYACAQAIPISPLDGDR